MLGIYPSITVSKELKLSWTKVLPELNRVGLFLSNNPPKNFSFFEVVSLFNYQGSHSGTRPLSCWSGRCSWPRQRILSYQRYFPLSTLFCHFFYYFKKFFCIFFCGRNDSKDTATPLRHNNAVMLVPLYFFNSYSFFRNFCRSNLFFLSKQQFCIFFNVCFML